MSGSQGLIGFEGCCCDPDPGNACDIDIDEFEFDPLLSGAAFYINPAIFYARFGVSNTYINMGWYEPYSPPTECTDKIEDDSDCCGGISGTETCCPLTGGACGQTSFLCCEPGQTLYPCGGTQGAYLEPELVPDLNVDGDGTAVFCCNCAGADPVLYCTSQIIPAPECNDGPGSSSLCPNQADDVAFLFNSSFTFSGGGGSFQHKIPCDNTTISGINSSNYGVINFVGVRRSGTLKFSMANVDFWQGATHTTCNTLMLRFTGQAQFCDSDLSPEKYATATWAKKYSPPSNLKTAGTFTIGRWYKIKFVGTTSFTSIGATSNTVGLFFQATGVGTGTGTAYEARTEAEVAATKVGAYDLRSIHTEEITSAEVDNGDHTWTGIERNTAFGPIMGDCFCHDPATGTCFGTSIQGSCGGAISVDYPTCYNMYTDVIPGITNIVNPPNYIVVSFT